MKDEGCFKLKEVTSLTQVSYRPEKKIFQKSNLPLSVDERKKKQKQLVRDMIEMTSVYRNYILALWRVKSNILSVIFSLFVLRRGGVKSIKVDADRIDSNSEFTFRLFADGILTVKTWTLKMTELFSHFILYFY